MKTIALLVLLLAPSAASAALKEDYLAQKDQALKREKALKDYARSAEHCRDYSEYADLERKFHAAPFDTNPNSENSQLFAKMWGLSDEYLAKGLDAFSIINGLVVVYSEKTKADLGSADYYLRLKDGSLCEVSAALRHLSANKDWAYPQVWGSCASPEFTRRELIALEPRCE